MHEKTEEKRGEREREITLGGTTGRWRREREKGGGRTEEFVVKRERFGVKMRERSMKKKK